MEKCLWTQIKNAYVLNISGSPSKDKILVKLIFTKSTKINTAPTGPFYIEFAFELPGHATSRIFFYPLMGPMEKALKLLQGTGGAKNAGKGKPETYKGGHKFV
jgi:hypothetical protein